MADKLANMHQEKRLAGRTAARSARRGVAGAALALALALPALRSVASAKPANGRNLASTFAERCRVLETGALGSKSIAACGKGTSRELRAALLVGWNEQQRFAFSDAERIAVAWGLAPRETAARRVSGHDARYDDDVSRPILASIYSLPSSLIAPEKAREFLSALVRATTPERTVLVLVDPAAERVLAPIAIRSDRRVRLLPSFGRAYSPWPRDPFSFARRADGGVTLVLRPNLQRGREEDANLARALLQTLPKDLDRSWRSPTWQVAAVPFHNGQILLTPDAAWITLHALEPAILNKLGLDRVPVESFGSTEGIDRYLAASRAAANDLASLVGRPVRFAHPLPENGELTKRVETLQRIGGGAGVDLDSIATLLPPTQRGKPRALVGDLAAGADLLTALSAEEANRFARGYDLAGPWESLRARLTAGARQSGLGPFLDLVAEHLAAQGFEVVRLPLLEIPYTTLVDSRGLPDGGTFLVGWNNAVLETRGSQVHAEAFESLLANGDRLAIAAYAAAGVKLTLLPALPESVLRGGGYRCASNHLRKR